MLERLPERRHVRRLSLLVIAVILFTALPSLYPAAAAPSFKPLDDSQGDFSQGSFQRTAIGSGSSSTFKDDDGALQLTAVGNLASWPLAQPDLPVPLGSMGVTTIGNRLYTVAGAGASIESYTDSVFWATANQQNGSFQPHGFTEATKPTGSTLADDYWVNDPLPAALAYMGRAPSSACNAAEILGRRSPAVASYVANNGNQYLYAIGGAFLPSTCSPNVLTSPVVQRGTVTPATGDITWTSGTDLVDSYLPSPNLPDLSGEAWDSPDPYVGLVEEALGVEGAAAVVMRDSSSGNAYLYVIGGLASYRLGSTPDSLVTPAVFYTRLSSTGAFENPHGLDNTGTPWARTANVPLNVVYTETPIPSPGYLGIFNHTAMVSRVTVDDEDGDTITREAIFVTGGYTSRPLSTVTANSSVFRAMFDTSKGNGELKWETVLNPAKPGEHVSTDGQGRAGAAGFAYGSKLYVIGGIPKSAGADPLGTVTTGVHNDAMNMVPLFTTTPSQLSEYFIGGGGEDVIDPVYGLGAGVIPATPIPGSSNQNAAWGYAVGGFSSGGTPSAQIFSGPIGGPSETNAEKRAPEGWFYSRVHDIQLAGDGDAKTEARMLSIRWFSQIDRGQNLGADMYLEFRRSSTVPCTEASFIGTSWVRLDANDDQGLYSGDGSVINQVKLRTVFPTENFDARCFQYRVYITRNGSTGGVPNAGGNDTVTPRLYKVDVETTKPGDPDLKLEAFDIGPNAKGQFSIFNLQIRNLNETIVKTAEAPEGNFPVVLCVARSEIGQPKPTLVPPTLPITGDSDDRVDCAPVYRSVDWSLTNPLIQPFAINTGWDANYNDSLLDLVQDQPIPNDIRGYFNRPGNYAVAVLIDPFNAVPELGAGKTDNRGENLNNGQPLIREFTISQTGYSTYLPMLRR